MAATSLSGKRIKELAAEWIVVQREIERSRQAAAERVASEWQAAFESMLSTYQAVVAAGEWQRGPTDLFNVLGIQRNEVRHSAMIAWMLDPLGRHGLGPKLLQGVFGSCFADDKHDTTGPLTVETEVSRGDTRADIVVWGPSFTAIIEVKVDAGEGVRQCDRLYQRFGNEPGALFLFLTPTGRSPTTATGDAADAFRTLSFSNLRGLLVRALAGTDAGVSRMDPETVRNYVRTLEKEFR